MQIDEAQRDVRLVYVGGFFGQLVSGALWLLAAAGSWPPLVESGNGDRWGPLTGHSPGPGVV